ncbi:MAG TPA: hypothetical protein VKC57_07295 [Ktedonobacterales bacterium]|nr:hypothetical protein [Ktedonobacterales bacterium]
MSKVKMKCPRCGKHFKSSSAKQALCPECEARERRARAASKAAPPVSTAGPAAPHTPKIVGPGAAILVPDLAGATVVEAEPSSAPTHRAPAAPGPGAHHAPSAATDKSAHETHGTKPTHTEKGRKTPPSPREPREPRAPAPLFQLTDDVRARVEARYIELADPVEFDGIRTQIADELGVSKPAVKRVVTELRKQMQLPSWWDLQAYRGTSAELELIRAAYVPTLPAPEVGVHKRIAADLKLDAGMVYQGIRRIRAEMHLPQYNPPELHREGQAAATESPAPPVAL